MRKRKGVGMRVRLLKPCGTEAEVRQLGMLVSVSILTARARSELRSGLWGRSTMRLREMIKDDLICQLTGIKLVTGRPVATDVADRPSSREPLSPLPTWTDSGRAQPYRVGLPDAQSGSLAAERFF